MILALAMAAAGMQAAVAEPPVEVRSSHGITLWPPRGIRRFRFCSRAPVPSRTAWTIGWADVARLEARLPEALTRWRDREPRAHVLPSAGFDRVDWSSRWRRNYIGIVVDGRRMIYGDFAPMPSRDGFSVCDGGPAYFGIVYDPATRTIVSLDANGI